MATKPSVLVGHIQDLAYPASLPEGVGGREAVRQFAVTFAGGTTGRLELTDPRSAVWAEVLQSLHEAGQPAYVEMDPESGLITEVLLPMKYTVGEMEPTRDGDIEVELVISHALHFLRRSNPRFQELDQGLRTARQRKIPVFVTETLNEHEIIDVRPTDALPEAAK